LDEETRAFMEPRIGYDFSRVRIYIDMNAAKINRALNAQAFTIGNKIVFGKNHFEPRTISGQKLLAHVLTHVIQQINKTSIQRQDDYGKVLNLPTATTRFVKSGRVRCCRDRGRNECPTHLGAARHGDPRPQNGLNLITTIVGINPILNIVLFK
jgi:hypothetical protein